MTLAENRYRGSGLNDVIFYLRGVAKRARRGREGAAVDRADASEAGKLGRYLSRQATPKLKRYLPML